MYDSWRDPERDWWLKLAHAEWHIQLAAEAEADYLERQPWRLEVEATDHSYLTNLRLTLLEEPPAAVVLHAGDALHSLSSALDAIAFALARAHYGVGFESEDRLQAATEFPVAHSWTALEAWSRERRRRGLFGTRELRALWWGQSYYWTATAFSEHGIGPAPGSVDEVEAIAYDSLRRLRHLHNVDKHRRLHVALLGPDLVHWGSTGETGRRVTTGGVWRDGEVVARVYEPPSDSTDGEINWDLRLVLLEEDRRDKLMEELRALRAAVGLSLDAVIRAMCHS